MGCSVKLALPQWNNLTEDFAGLNTAVDDLALQVARSFCFPLPCCRETKFSLDLKLTLRVFWITRAAGWSLRLERARSWRWGGLRLGRVVGHVSVWSEGGTTGPRVKGSTGAWLYCVLALSVLAVGRSPVGETRVKWGVIYSAALPCSLCAESSPGYVEAAGFRPTGSSNEFGSNNQ